MLFPENLEWFLFVSVHRYAAALVTGNYGLWNAYALVTTLLYAPTRGIRPLGVHVHMNAFLK